MKEKSLIDYGDVLNQSSKSILGISWEECFPLTLSPSRFKVERSCYEQVLPFYKENFSGIYGPSNGQFLDEEYTEEKKRFYQQAGDFFSFIDCSDNKVVGVFVGTLHDWSTYYFRNCSILPEFQGQGLYQQFLNRILTKLEQHQVKRIEAHVAPSNFGSIHVLNKLRFNITGMQLSERWGALVHFTRFLCEPSKGVFLGQFCHRQKPEKGKGDL